MKPIRLKPKKRTLKPFLATAATAVAIGLVVSGCATGGDVDEPTAFSDTVKVGTSAIVTSLNPLEVQYNTVQRAAYDSLVRQSGTDFEPSLALEWDNPDDNTWVFKLREGVTFHDGSEFTAEDVVFSIQEVIDQAYPAQPQFASFESVTATDDYTLTIVTSEPDPLMLTKLSQLFIVPSDAWQEIGPEGFAVGAIGTGPYRVTEFVPDGAVTFTANEDYWGDAPKTQTVIYQGFSDQTALAGALEAGEIDVAHVLANSAIQTLDGNSDFVVSSSFGGDLTYFQMNTQQEPFSNPELRRAANLAVDADALIAALTYGAGVKEDGQLTPPGVFGHSDKIIRPAYDLEEARSILEKEDAVGAEVTITGMSIYKQLYEAVGAQLEEAGFSVTIEATEIPVWVDMFRSGTDADLFFRGMSYVGTQDADRPLSFISASASPMVVDPKWDELFAATRLEMDPAEREKKLIAANKYINEQNFILWTYGRPAVGAHSTAVSGVDFTTGLALRLDTIQMAE